MAVVIETTLGDITVDLFVDERPRSKLTSALIVILFYVWNLIFRFLIVKLMLSVYIYVCVVCVCLYGLNIYFWYTLIEHLYLQHVSWRKLVLVTYDFFWKYIYVRNRVVCIIIMDNLSNEKLSYVVIINV